MNELNRRLRRVESPNITYVTEDGPIYWQRALGSEVWDTGGKRYIDFSSAFGVASIGHCHPEVALAIEKQSRLLIAGMGDVHPTELKVLLLERLRAIFGVPARGILSSTGSEAVESALKTAMFVTGKPGVIAFEGAYHGLGYGALAATSRSVFRQPFLEQLGIPVMHAPFPETEEEIATSLALVEVKLAEGATGAVLIEPIQGRGGIRVPAAGFLRRLYDLTQTHGALFILDEILTGLGRTGAMLACQHEDVLPDIVCLGKALGGGLPISAAIGRSEVMDVWPESNGEAIHTSTFLGHPLACRSALATLEVIEHEQLCGRAARLGAMIAERLAAWRPRGRGLMIGLPLATARQAQRVVRTALERGLILLMDGDDGNVVELLPPLTTPEPLLDEGLAILESCLADAG